MGYPIATLLERPRTGGYPAEYLLARIRARRSRLTRDWTHAVDFAAPDGRIPSSPYLSLSSGDSPDAVWRGLRREFRWIYHQMNGVLREKFAPFFLYAELKTLFACLRHIGNEFSDRKTLDDLLSYSLLCCGVKAVLTSSGNIAAAVEGVEHFLGGLSHIFRGLGEAEKTGGLRAVESGLTARYLDFAAQNVRDAVLLSFFIRIIDSRNIMSLYKHIRLEGKVLPLMIQGGTIGLARFTEIAGRRDIAEIGELIYRVTGGTVARPDATSVEVALYRAITRWLRKAGRDPLSASIFLDYLWRCHIEAMNVSVILHGRALDRDAVMAEIVS